MSTPAAGERWYSEGARRLQNRLRALPPVAVDTGIAAVCAVYIVIQKGVEGDLTWWIPLLAVVNAVPLLWRRRFPFMVTLLTGISTTWLAILGALGHFPAAQLVATYTFATLSPPFKRLVAALGTIAGILMSILIPDEDALNLGLVGIAFATTYALGTNARARRDRIEMLEERTRRLAEQQDAAATRERERIAREMHDILAHSMGLVVVQAEAGPVAVRRDPDKASEMFDAISETARDSLTQLRRALGVLRAEDGARVPVPDLDAIPGLLAHVRDSGIAATLAERGDRRTVAPETAAAVYRIVQESLTNTLKHAAASRVDVTLDWHDDALDLEVRDDGNGPAGSANGTGSGGHGLSGMRERAAALGGELSNGPDDDGAGFRIAARLPLQ
ncbi:signal transduction histidine kinase [Haloactinopolyspora alba]|uniref:histidine kinase n=1 Tax=Haloactinopolyspora alba TaxID=648780 RepID=A0A2P8DVR7_9ACTN|nr:sensor histidine kinase [Haloactinopolyspora alba]PSL01295.1 signal transduction histidine kinase [Haloactinopolyspora alba]